MSQYPETIDVFTDKTGADNIISSDPNNAFDAAEAIQGLIGALGKPQSWSTTLMTLLRKHRRGLVVSVSAGTLKVSEGEAVLEDTNASKYAFRRNASDVTIAAANLDVGSLAATFYYIYALAGVAATTAPIIFSTDAYAPSAIGTKPYTKLGWFYNESVGALAVTYAGNLKNGYDLPNIIQTIGALGATYNSTSYVDVASLSAKFISSGRPMRFIFNVGGNSISAVTRFYSQFTQNGTAIANSEKTSGGSLDSYINQHTNEFVGVLAAGAYTIGVQYKMDGASSLYVIGNHNLIVEEL